MPKKVGGEERRTKSNGEQQINKLVGAYDAGSRAPVAALRIANHNRLQRKRLGFGPSTIPFTTLTYFQRAGLLSFVP